MSIIENKGTAFQEKYKKQLEGEGRPELARKYVYLLDAQVFANGRTYTLPSSKVDLSHVGSWSLGFPG